MAAPRACAACAQPSSFYCTRCATPYCSAACQAAHWRAEHKTRCARLAVAHLAHRMSPGFVAETALGSAPLRAVTQVDGLGQLGVCLFYSGHLGLAAARPMLAPLRHRRRGQHRV